MAREGRRKGESASKLPERVGTEKRKKDMATYLSEKHFRSTVYNVARSRNYVGE
jgi:hypothetical protein